MRSSLFFLLLAGLLLGGCSASRQIGRSARALVNDSSLQSAHVGISIYEPATGKWWYNWQGNKYFVPASNTKLATCYAAMKHLGDSLNGFSVVETLDSIYFRPNGDPTFLHPDFSQSFFWSLAGSGKKLVQVFEPKDRFDPWGDGWAWNDYLGDYMAERSRFPMYGNVVRFRRVGNLFMASPKLFLSPKYFYEPAMQLIGRGDSFSVTREMESNLFRIISSPSKFWSVEIPFKTDMTMALQQDLLRDTLNKAINLLPTNLSLPFRKYKTQPTDSLLRPMMHRSDNFFAEQSLLMVSNEMLGFMNDEKIIDTLLKTDLKGLPQKPRWVDGSGLSRYNLFTPQDFVAILNKMQNESGRARIRTILPTGNEGTLSNYYKSDSTAIYAKTGTLSGVVALSGYLTTGKGKELIFSVLVNNHRGSATAVRRAVEKFIQNLRRQH